MLRLVCLVLLASIVSAIVPFKDCGHSEVKTLEISGCTTSPCTLHKGKTVEIDVEFTANQNTEKVQIHVSAHVALFTVQIPGIDTNGCNHVECPLVSGQTYKFKYSIPIPTSAPTINADLTAKLTGDHGALACITVKGSIKN